MLTQDDINWIKSNREEILMNRTEPVVVKRMTERERDPYTDEPYLENSGYLFYAKHQIIEETVQVVWKEFSTVSKGDRHVIGGIELKVDDVKVSFDYHFNLEGVTRLVRNEVEYEIIATDPKGIGETNRVECLARRLV